MVDPSSIVLSFAFSVVSIFLYLVGATTMFLVERTRLRHPSLKIYLRLLGVILAHWLVSALVHFLGTLQLQPARMNDLLMYPASAPWIALVTIPERFLLAWEIYLILLSGLVSTKTLRGRPSRRRHAVLFAFLVVFLVGERIVNLFYFGAAPDSTATFWRGVWYSVGNLMTLVASALTMVRLVRNRKKAVFDYLGRSYQSLGWGMAFYLGLIVGLALVGVFQPDLLSSLGQSIWYMLSVSVLLIVLGCWNLSVGFRVLSTSLDAKENKTLHAQANLGDLGLSDRETEIVWWLAQGLVNKEVARRLNLADATVKNHIYRIYKKLGITSRAGLVRVLTRINHKAPSGL